MQRGVKRTLLDAQQVARDLVDMGRDGVAVQLPMRGHGLEQQQGQRALQDVLLLGRHSVHTCLCIVCYVYYGSARPLSSEEWGGVGRKVQKDGRGQVNRLFLIELP